MGPDRKVSARPGKGGRASWPVPGGDERRGVRGLQAHGGQDFGPKVLSERQRRGRSSRGGRDTAYWRTVGTGVKSVLSAIRGTVMTQ